MKFSRLERLYQTPKKWKLAFQKYKLSNSFFKMQLQICVFPNFNLQIVSSKSNLRSPFANLFNFKFSKTCWKIQNYIQQFWLILKNDFEKKHVPLREMGKGTADFLFGDKEIMYKVSETHYGSSVWNEVWNC